MPGELLADRVLLAYQDHTHAQLARRQDGPFHLGSRGVISSHGIERNCSHRGSRGNVIAWRKVRPLRPSCQSLRGPCNTRTVGRPGAASSSHGTGGTWKGSAPSDGGGNGANSCAF